ncbi:hypothetical protein DPMN_090235 [Dreissena polymorpha]|uniref:VWFA domain-containing protein n=1 Tax=Dreissena polymorpha TaxID=45954 RepID=A0A9D4KXV8_DREPO|nr:hypothetical protein DPMN_090235 [Dreissena polymorpha]
MLQSRGNRLPGLNIEKFTFVLTDGMSTDRKSTAAEALSLRSLSTVVVVGIGQMVSHEELQRIASPPDEFTMSYVFAVKNFDSLHSLIDRLIDATCGKCSTRSRTDIIALIDDLSTSNMTSSE